MDGKSLNVTEDLISKLKEIIPGAFTEDKINVEQLKHLLGESINTDSERYHLNWAGKNDAYKVLQETSKSTLNPDFKQSINWEETENIFIEGENLDALKILQKPYYGKIKMVYIDPPYNTGSDNFIYPDKFSESKEEYLQRINQKDEDGLLTREGLFRQNRKENGQFHSNWLSMMLPRLFLARNLLKDEGVIFVSIDDNEYSNLKLLLNEIFGEENFVSTLMWRRRKTQANLSKFISPVHDYILCYAKNIEKLEFNKLPYSDDFIKKTFNNPDNDPRGVYQTRPLAQPENSSNPSYELKLPNGRKITAKWSCSPDTFKKYVEEDRLYIPKGGEGMPRLKIFLSELDGLLPNTWLDDIATNEEGSKEVETIFGSNAFFTAPKPTNLIKHLLKLGSNSGDIILDFFAGSGSTAHAVLALNKQDGGNRKFICIQLPEPVEEKSIPHQKGYKSISSISIKRIQSVINSLNSSPKELFTNQHNEKVGFRVFRLENSNFKIWRTDNISNSEELKKQVELFKSSILPDSLDSNMLWELLLKSGIPLSSKISKWNKGEKTIYYSTSYKLAISFSEIDNTILDFLIQLKPSQFICLDKSFKNEDSKKTNIQLKLEDNGITFKTI
ncbi:site-specific DNA-methyltransferase [Siphonobacter sp. BAB-5405]|uniref:site-specific DNA-methyltransferase n=1 Tax=Siphonobacter sp. BAB-5405 TaxID=1864825 RepID=UPI0013049DBC|nr:site-specific DNA-methyltransferase [Siphonobacter sp. BAB-5405]